MLKHSKTHLSGIIYMLIFSATLPFSDSVVKILTQQYVSLFQIIFIRAVIICIALFPFLLNRNELKISKEKWKWYLLYSVAFFLSMVLWLMCLDYIPLAQLYTIGFLSPILASVGGVIFFKEKMTKTIALSLCGGFLGALIIIRPGFQGSNAYLLVAIICTLIWTAGILISKYLSSTESQIKITFFMFLSVIPFSTLMGISNWGPITLPQFGLIGIVSAISIISFLSLFLAYKKTPLTILAPIEFTQIIFSFTYGWILFNESIDIWTIVGGLIISVSALTVMKRSSS
jgi:drug/metabolite transporter (DMT)-like permease